MLVSSGWGPGYPEILHMFDLSSDERWKRHGRGSFDPVQSVLAGDYVTVTFSFDIGETPVPEGGKLGIAWRWPLDWSDLQSESPEADGYLIWSLQNLGSDQPAPVCRMAYHRFGGVEPWHHYLALEVTSGELRQGNQLRVVCGDRSAGSRGWRAPTCAAQEAGFLMLIDGEGKGHWIRLPDPPGFAIQPGLPCRLVAVAPSDGVVGESGEVLIRAEDTWGNPTDLQDKAARLEIKSPDGAIVAQGAAKQAASFPTYWLPIRFEKAGTTNLSVSVPDTEWNAESNPIRVHGKPPASRTYWGDLHAGQGEIGCGRGSLADHYAFGKEAAGLSFITHQGNDHYVTVAEWELTRRVTREFVEPGRYVPFLGCEWSPPTRDGGDRNVFYRHDEPRLRRSGRFFVESDPDPEPDLPHAPEFLDAMKDQEVLINMHVGGRPTNLDWHEPRIERLAEIHSTHGTSEWFVMDALGRGYQPAITAGTDGVMGRPGACCPGWRLIRNLPNGLTAVLAEDLTPDALWAALQARRCYATSGPRILLNVEVDGHPMGSAYESTGMPVVKIAVTGTAAIERIDLLRGTEVISSHQTALPAGESGRYRILWGGTQKRGTARAQTVIWDGSLTVESGKISDISPVGYFGPCDEVQQTNASTVQWRSATAGNNVGIQFQLESHSDAVARFVAKPCSFDFRIDQAKLAPLVVDAGGLGRKVSVGPAPAHGTRRVEMTIRDTQPFAGMAAYWVRVTQVDQARAWSSPVYVTRS